MAESIRISVVGSGRTLDATGLERARAVGTEIARAGCVLVCGGLGGTMQAACEGAAGLGGQTIGILPGQDPCRANPFVGCAVATGLGQLRNGLVVMNGHAVIALPGGWGTQSEVALARKSGKPVVCFGWQSPPNDVHMAESAPEAVALVIGLAKTALQLE